MSNFIYVTTDDEQLVINVDHIILLTVDDNDYTAIELTNGNIVRCDELIDDVMKKIKGE